jgi:hypothetical protein
MAMINLSINLIYDVKDGVDMDTAVSAVTGATSALMSIAGIKDGRPDGSETVPLFWPKAIRQAVDLTEVKQLMVISDGD